MLEGAAIVKPNLPSEVFSCSSGKDRANLFSRYFFSLFVLGFLFIFLCFHLFFKDWDKSDIVQHKIAQSSVSYLSRSPKSTQLQAAEGQRQHTEIK